MTTLKKIAAAVCAAACIASVSAAPDDISKLNPYGLVYQGAVKTNTAGEVNIHPVTYSLHGIKIAANVYTPANYDAKQSYPAVVVAHPNGGTKEQVAGLFAQRLAELGYITIAADAAYQGASGASRATPTNRSSVQRISTAWPRTSSPIPALMPLVLARSASAAGRLYAQCCQVG